MSDLLAGLESMGLGGLKDLDVYETEDKKAAEETNKEKGIQEEDLLLDKSYTCTMCDKAFKSKGVRAGHIRAAEADMDLRPRYEGIDVLKYDAIACPYCGYAAYAKEFPYLTSMQRKAIQENICSSYVAKERDESVKIYSYEEAIERSKLILVNTIVKRGKISEKANVCLRIGWLLRGMAETLDQSAEDYEARKKECEEGENEFLRSAYDGFVMARASEAFPISGMDQLTLDYLLAALAIRFEDNAMAAKLIGGILTSKTAKGRIKDKAHDLKEILMERKRKNEQDV